MVTRLRNAARWLLLAVAATADDLAWRLTPKPNDEDMREAERILTNAFGERGQA